MFTTLIILAVLVAIALAAVVILHHPSFGRKPDAQRKTRIDNSPNYRDGMFRNEELTPQFTGDRSAIATMWDYFWHRPKDRVPTKNVQAVKTDLKSLPTDRDWLVWFGHSSYLFCLNGKRYLVDPLLKMEFPASVMMKPFKGTDIYTPDDIPAVDYLVITHEHWDHLDYATLRDLRGKVAHAVCPLGIGEYLEYWGYDKSIITEMDWGEQFDMPIDKTDGVNTRYSTVNKVTCLPTRHFSNRLFARNQTLWASFMIEDGSRKVYIGGDGGYDSRFKRIREQFGPVDLAFLENGQYNSDWKYIHTTPEGLEQAILDLQAKQIFTVHHDKFALAKHPWYEPDSVAQTIAKQHHIRLLDKPIGTVIEF